MRRRPYSVVLFDEIEKAHPDVFNMLLQVLDDGRLTDSLGHVVDFKNTILIMTSNLGTALIGKRTSPGFLSASAEDTYDRMKERVLDELKRAFRPEFLNRIDEVIVFHSLSEEHIRGIVQLMIERVNRQLEERAIRVGAVPRGRELPDREGLRRNLRSAAAAAHHPEAHRGSARRVHHRGPDPGWSSRSRSGCRAKGSSSNRYPSRH